VTVAGPGAPAGPRLRPGDRRDLGLVGWTVSTVSGRVAGSGPPNLFRTLGRHRPLFRGWLRFAGRLMPGGTLPRRETELVIIRVATLAGCDYEREHHLRLGRRAGVTDEDVLRLDRGPTADGWSPREAAILAAVDELHATHDVSDETWSAVGAHLSDRELIELVLLVGHYEMLATFITTLRIEPDAHR